jgi:FtsH-binding integral membrane protein
MAQFDSSYSRPTTSTRVGGDVDAGLRTYMLGVYNYMAAGVALTGIVAYLLYSLAVTTDPGAAAATLKNGMGLTSFGVLLYTSPLKWVLMLAPLAFVFFFAYKANSMSVPAAQTSFWIYAALVGASISVVLLVFTGASIARVFFISAATFASLSVWAYTTKRDLSGWGSFLFMGMIGIIIAALVNIFLQSSAMQFAISCVGVLVFAGFTAYDTQRIKDDYYAAAGDATMVAKASIFGALSLYIDFVGLFMNLLTLLGDRE